MNCTSTGAAYLPVGATGCATVFGPTGNQPEMHCFTKLPVFDSHMNAGRGRRPGFNSFLPGCRPLNSHRSRTRKETLRGVWFGSCGTCEAL
jgi:hypothetical protein